MGTRAATVMAVDAIISLATAKRSAGPIGPSGSDSKKRSASNVVARAVAQSRVSAGAPGRSQATMATTPERVCSFAAAGAVGVAAVGADDRRRDLRVDEIIALHRPVRADFERPT